MGTLGVGQRFDGRRCRGCENVNGRDIVPFQMLRRLPAQDGARRHDFLSRRRPLAETTITRGRKHNVDCHRLGRSYLECFTIAFL
jgi:hypothetical protein